MLEQAGSCSRRPSARDRGRRLRPRPLEEIGLQLVVYVNTERVCAKELVLFPHQICPEHRHPPSAPTRARRRRSAAARAPCAAHPGRTRSCSPGRQFTILPDTLHWFQAGPRVRSSPSSRRRAATSSTSSAIRRSFDSEQREPLVDLARQAAHADRADAPLAVEHGDAAEEEREERVEARPLDRVVAALTASSRVVRASERAAVYALR